MKASTSALAFFGVAAVASALAFTALANPVPSPGAPARLVGAKADNFMLPDQNGLGHELYYHAQQPAVVILSAALGDPTSDRAIAALTQISQTYKARGVEFLVLNSSPRDTRDAIAAASANISLPVLDDELQLVGRSLGVTETAEVFVIKPGAWTVAYHGPIDASFAQQRSNRATLTAALDAMIAGRAPAVTEAAVNGTTVDFPDRARAAEFARISYANDVAPILAAKCVACHTTGGMAPFAMNSYQTVKGFAPMIREALRTKRMPPFHSDSHWGNWSNNMLLSDNQIRTVVNWIEAGAPRGTGEDPLPAAARPAPEWPLGQPDVVVDIPAFDVPASGIIDYQDRSVATNFANGQGRWLKATAWSNASPSVHHALAGWIPQVREDGRGFSWNTSLGGYGPGGEANTAPADTGIWIPPGGSFAWQMHYTSTGRALTDHTKVGYYFYDTPPTYILRQASITDFSLQIPAGEARHHEQAYLEIPHDIDIYGTQPHCHSRCFSTKLRIRYPDGREEVLLNQPRYFFEWQREYHFDGMLRVPAGSLLIADYVYDNSTANPHNPDATHDVTFGEQTSEEMLFTFFRFRWVGETRENRHDDWQQQLQSNVVFGALDDNIDRKLSPQELSRDARFRPLLNFLPVVDTDHDGSLSVTETAAAMQMMQRSRPAAGAAAAAPREDAGAAAMRQAATGEAPAH
jgi:mono/diheme cytochrome c family protein